MSKLKTLNEEQERILHRAGINPEGYGLEHADENKMVLKHFKTGFEVWIRKDGKRSW